MPFKNDVQPKVGIPASHSAQLPPADEVQEMGFPDGAEYEVMDPEVQPDAEGNYPPGTKVVATYVFVCKRDASWKPKRTRVRRKSQNGTSANVPSVPPAKGQPVK